MNKKDARVISVICVFLGLLLYITFTDGGTGVNMEDTTGIKKLEGLINEQEALKAQHDKLLDKRTEYEKKMDALEEQAAHQSSFGQDIKAEIINARMVAGLMDVHGPGIEILLNDRKRDDVILRNPDMISNYIVHDSDLLNIVNELRAAGAEAISINDTRIIETSRISCGGPTINIGSQNRFAPPFIIKAIGNPDELASVFQREDSIYKVLMDWGLEFHIKKVEDIKVPANYGSVWYQYAKIVEEGD